VDLRALSELSDDDLEGLYAVTSTPWLRVNMVSTIDGAATGPDGRSGSVNNAADKRVFDTLRRLCDCVVVGAGTARAEGYRDVSKPLVLVSRRADVPDQLRGAAPGSVLMATCAAADGLAEARSLLGDEHVLVLGPQRVDLAELKRELAVRGFGHVLSEGGPHLLRDLLAEGVVDELDLTVVPRLLAGDQLRITQGPPVDVPLRPVLLLEDGGTLLGRWLVEQRPGLEE
jgi:riboflavin biosynthesis pyrimidine reductase